MMQIDVIGVGHMAMFEVGEEYWLSWGTIDEQFLSPIKVVAQDGTWLQIEAEKADLDPLINLAAPLFISARKRDRLREQEAAEKFQRQEDIQRRADAERINQFRTDQAKGIL